MINLSTFFTSFLSSARFNSLRVILVVLLIMISTIGFAQLFTQASTQTDASGSGLGVPMLGTPAANVIFSSAGKVNGVFDVGNIPCSSGYAGFTPIAGINTYSTTGPAIEISLSPSSTYFLSATGVSATIRRSSTGPVNGTFAYSTNGGTTWIDNGPISLPSVACQSGTVFTWSFACPVTVTELQTFMFRIYIFGSTSATGTTQIENLTVNGSCIACTALTAVISGTTSICAGSNTNITFTGTPSSTITYNINGGSNLTITLNCTGSAILNTGALASTTTYNLVNVGVGLCSHSISGSAVVTVVPQISSAVISGTTSICSGSTTNLSVMITGGISPYTVVYFNGVSNTTVNSYISGTAIPVSPIITTTYTLVSVTGSGGCSSSANSGSAVITMAPAPTSSVLSGTTGICTGSSANLSVTITGGTSPYTVVYFNGASNTTLNNYVSGTPFSVSPAATTTYSLVSVAGANGCPGSGNSGTAVITVTAPGTWKGINTNWNDPLNWCDGTIPSASTNVIVPSGLSFYPVITTPDPQVKNITIAAGANINIQATGTFSIAGLVSSSGTMANSGIIAINGTTGLQNFPPAPGLTLSPMTNLVINNAAGVNMSNTLSVAGTLTLTNGIFTVGAFTLTIAKPIAGTVNNLSANNTSSINIAGAVAGVNIPASVSQLKNVSVINSVGTVLQGNLSIANLLTIGAAAGTVDAGLFTLNGTGGLTMAGGNLLLSKNGVVLPELGGAYNLTGGVGGTVTFNGSGVTASNAQTIRPVNYFNLTSSSTGDRILSNSGTIGIANVFTPSTNSYTISGSTVNFNKANNQNIPAFSFNNLILSGGGFTKTMMGSISIQGTLTFAANTKLALVDNDVRLKSTVLNTANVANIPTANSITYGNGRFIVERYIPVGVTHNKSWQFLSVPVTAGQTIKDAWQETAAGGPPDNPNPGYGTQLTSSLPTALALGFDFYTPAGSSMKVYNSLSGLWDNMSSTLIPISNTKGYMLFVRGDRSVTAYNQLAVATIMRAKGKLYSPGTDAPASVTVPAGKFESVGNPYASAIDLTILATLQTGDVQNLYYVWDPLLTTGPNSAFGLGGYRTLTYNGTDYDVTPPGGSYGTNARYIQSGQTFFVKSFSTGGTVNFTENCKAAGSAMVNRPGWAVDMASKLKTNLYVLPGQQAILIDGVMTKFDKHYTPELNNKDAYKIKQLGETISILKDSLNLAVACRNLLKHSDSILLYTGQMKQQVYQLEFIPENINRPGLVAYLEDRFLNTHTQISLSDTTRISFQTNAGNPSSMASDRFRIIFTKDHITSPLPNIDASAKRSNNNTAVVEWQAENDIIKYETERSNDGINFYVIGNAVSAHDIQGLGSYRFVDATVTKEVNYYRVKVTRVDGKILFSKVCNIPASDNSSMILVYPNPVTYKRISIHFRNIPDGSYKVQLVNNAGQVVLNKWVKLDDSTGPVMSFFVGNTVPTDVYNIQVSNDTGFKYVQQLFVE